MDSKTFDNGTICASEQSVVCDEDMEDAVQDRDGETGSLFPDRRADCETRKIHLKSKRHYESYDCRKESAQVIADLAGIDIPAGTKVTGSKRRPVSEVDIHIPTRKLAPILAFYTAPMIIRRSAELGAGDSAL